MKMDKLKKDDIQLEKVVSELLCCAQHNVSYVA